MASIKMERKRVRREFNRIGWQYARSVKEQTKCLSEYLSGLPLPPKARILDVACGPGTYSIPLAHHGGWVVGLDLAESMLQYARQRSPRPGSNLMFLQGDALHLPFASENFDLCLCAFSFAHFPQPKQVVKEMLRVLRPQGRLAIFDVIAPEGPKQRSLLNRLEKTRECCYTRIRDLQSFKRMFASSSLAWENCCLESRTITFAQWVAASHLRSPSPSFQKAKKLFEIAAQQQSVAEGLPRVIHCRYCYRVILCLLRKIA